MSPWYFNTSAHPTFLLLDQKKKKKNQRAYTTKIKKNQSHFFNSPPYVYIFYNKSTSPHSPYHRSKFIFKLLLYIYSLYLFFLPLLYRSTAKQPPEVLGTYSVAFCARRNTQTGASGACKFSPGVDDFWCHDYNLKYRVSCDFVLDKDRANIE